MISKKDIEKLGALSRLSLSEAEAESLTKDIQGILGYVEELQEVSGELLRSVPNERNVFREDGEPHASGLYTEAIIKEAPHTEDGYIKVKKILG